jgi:hypothetical protein
MATADEVLIVGETGAVTEKVSATAAAHRHLIKAGHTMTLTDLTMTSTEGQGAAIEAEPQIETVLRAVEDRTRRS